MADDLTFCRRDHELITKFLRPKIADATVKFSHTYSADVYSAAPPDLAAAHAPARGTDRLHGDGGTDGAAVYYFFCPAQRQRSAGGVLRRNRAVGGGGNGEQAGCWHPESGEKAVLDAGGRRVRHLRKLSYGVREKGDSRRRLTRLRWCMTEFGVDHHDGGGGGLVLCKMYRSPRGAEACQSATAAAAASITGSKRTAGADDDLADAPALSRPHWMNHAGMMMPPAAGFKEEEETFVQIMDDGLVSEASGHPPCAAAAPDCGGDIFSAASGVMACPATPATAPAPATVGSSGNVAIMELPASPEGEFTWDKKLTWIEQVLLS